MPSGQTQEVSTIHFGLGASYFVGFGGWSQGESVEGSMGIGNGSLKTPLPLR